MKKISKQERQKVKEFKKVNNEKENEDKEINNYIKKHENLIKNDKKNLCMKINLEIFFGLYFVIIKKKFIYV